MQSFKGTGGVVKAYALHHFMEFLINAESGSDLQGLKRALVGRMTGMVAHSNVILRSIASEDPNCNRAILIVKARNHSFREGDLQADASILTSALCKVGIQPQISLHVAGELNEPLTPEGANEVVTRALTTVKAKSVEHMACDGCLSVSAHAKKGPRHIWTGASPMNLQVAVHIDKARSATNILVGTPIILDSY